MATPPSQTLSPSAMANLGHFSAESILEEALDARTRGHVLCLSWLEREAAIELGLACKRTPEIQGRPPCVLHLEAEGEGYRARWSSGSLDLGVRVEHGHPLLVEVPVAPNRLPARIQVGTHTLAVQRIMGRT